ncbi:hypothetical protein MNBD_NITROSPINAE03-1635 [hydrothermal vent metagenome]|uniref:DUF3047 domain-containing protein n=1 Tax=hydrothermal vent metagenome TaxID=652676 RepID=A0A3B1CY21_9ZZZZ
MMFKGFTSLFFVFAFIATCTSAVANNAKPLDLSFSAVKSPDGLPVGWEPVTFRSIKRHTSYRVVNVDGSAVLKAESDNSASGLMHSVDRPATSAPILKWKWKIAKTLKKGDARYKTSDDFSARIYVIFGHEKKGDSLGRRIKLKLEKYFMGRYSSGAALNYIWANRLPKNSSIKNAYSEREIMIAVESGDDLAGRWVEESVDIEADYRKYFKADPPQVLGLAIMTDTDNTGGKAEAWYADIRLMEKTGLSGK